MLPWVPHSGLCIWSRYGRVTVSTQLWHVGKREAVVRADLAECLVGVAAQHVSAGRHLFLADKEPLVVSLVTLPWQAALEQEKQSVRKRLQIIAARCCAAEVGMHACIAHSAAEDIRALVILDMRAADKVLPPSRCMGTM